MGRLLEKERDRRVELEFFLTIGVKVTFSPMITVSFVLEVSTAVFCCPFEISEKEALFLAFVGAAELLIEVVDVVVVVVLTATASACTDFAGKRFRFELGILLGTKGEGGTSSSFSTAFTVLLLLMALDEGSLRD